VFHNTFDRLLYAQRQICDMCTRMCESRNRSDDLRGVSILPAVSILHTLTLYE